MMYMSIWSDLSEVPEGYDIFSPIGSDNMVGFKLGRYNYWVFTGDANSTKFAIGTYDNGGNLVETWEYPGLRYINTIEVDEVAGKLVFIGQFNGSTDRLTIDWTDFIIE